MAQTALATDDIEVKPPEWMQVAIYQITFPDGTFYIGSSFQVTQRVRTHNRRLRYGKHENWRIQKAWDEFGRMDIRPILYCRKDDLLLYEQLAMDALDPKLNISPVAGRNAWTEESRAKVGKTRKGFRHTLEARAKISKAKKGWRYPPMTAEHKLKLSLANMGKNKRASRVGWNHSEEAKKRISQTKKENWRRLCQAKESRDAAD